MTFPLLFATSILLSILATAMAGVVAEVGEKVTDDPKLRERLWGLAFYTSVLPPAIFGLTMILPPPVQEAMRAPLAGLPLSSHGVREAGFAAFAPEWSFRALLNPIAIGATWMALLMTLGRFGMLILGCRRLMKRIASTKPASAALLRAVRRQAEAVGIAVPEVRVAERGEALLVGFRRPVLILDAYALRASTRGGSAVIAHELAHLARGDHRLVWIEEMVLVVLAANPLLVLIRQRRRAAGEEACDAVALKGADREARRDYARGLIAALGSAGRHSAPAAVYFNQSSRRQVMRRLRSVIVPRPRAPRPIRWGLGMLGLGIAGVIGLATTSLANDLNYGDARRPAIGNLAVLRSPDVGNVSSTTDSEPPRSSALLSVPRTDDGGFHAAEPGQSMVTLAFEVRGEGLDVFDGDVLRVWIDGPLDGVSRQPRMLEYPMATGPFPPLRAETSVSSMAGQGALYAYRAEVEDREGRTRFETWGVDSAIVADTPVTRTVVLMPSR